MFSVLAQLAFPLFSMACMFYLIYAYKDPASTRTGMAARETASKVLKGMFLGLVVFLVTPNARVISDPAPRGSISEPAVQIYSEPETPYASNVQSEWGVTRSKALSPPDAETAAISRMEGISTSEETFRAYVSTRGAYGTLAELKNVHIIDHREVIDGYRYTIIIDSAGEYHAYAIPVTYGHSGRRSFYVDSSRIIRGADKAGRMADRTDPPLR
jgi:hypothetical protein